VAGCSGDGGDGSDPTATTTAASDAVPSEYETATSLDGTGRDPDALSSKDAVNYQSGPQDGQ
jgi:hypothetical protein